MKKTIQAAVIGILIFSCQEKEDPQLTNEQIFDQVVENINNNAVLLDSAFDLTAKAIKSHGVLEKYLDKAESKEELITSLNELIEDIFDEAIEKNKKQLGLDVKRSTFTAGDSELEKYLTNPLTDDDEGLDKFAQAIDQQAEKKPEWIEVESFSLGAIPSSLPTEQLSLNYERIHHSIEIFNLVKKFEDPEELDDAIDDFLADKGDNLIYPLLLPAIQAAREAAKPHQKLEEIVFDEKLSDYQSEWEQQQRGAGLLGGVELVVNDGYDNSNEKTMSVDVLRAVYQAIMTEMWSQLYESQFE